MGLDMYLNKKTYIRHDDRKSLKIAGAKIPIKGENVKTIIEDAGYWRKANAVHAWFVENIQGGDDNCGEYFVPEKKMKELLETIRVVLANSKLVEGDVVESYSYDKDGNKVVQTVKGKVIENSTIAKKLLPTAEGFFFGGTDYDQTYIDDLEDTKKILEEALKNGDSDYYYQADW